MSDDYEVTNQLCGLALMQPQNSDLIFHPSAGENSSEDDFEDEMIKPVNPNEHIFNDNDGGRTRKLRHVSKIDCFKRGHEAVLKCRKDLFNVKARNPAIDVQVLDPTPSSTSFAQIIEQTMEESPSGRAVATDQSMRSESQPSPEGFSLGAPIRCAIPATAAENDVDLTQA